MTAGMAGRLSSVSLPWPWTGAENVDGRAVGFAEVLVGATVMVEDATLTDEAAIEVGLMVTDEVVTKVPTLIATIVDELMRTPTRGEDDPPTLIPMSAPDDPAEEALTVELGLTEVTARATTASVRGAAMERPQKTVVRARNFMLR